MVYKVDWEEVENEEEERLEFEKRFMFCVQQIEVFPPPNRMDLECFIYGQISFNDGLQDSPVTLFNHRSDNSDYVILGDEDVGFLLLTDDHSDRPLCSVPNRLYANFKLYEQKKKKGSEDEEDELIADINNFKHKGPNMLNRCTWFDVGCDSGFVFRVSYVHVHGARLHVDLWINKSHIEDKDEIEAPILLWGYVDVLQEFEDNQFSSIILKYKYDDNPMAIDIGTPIPIPLERNIVVTPPRAYRCLYVSMGLNICGVNSIIKEEIPFPDLQVYEGPRLRMVTNKLSTHVEPVPGTMFSISIKLIE